MKVKDNNHPYIIAVGSSIENISYYFIEIEKHLMCVSICFVRLTEACICVYEDKWCSSNDSARFRFHHISILFELWICFSKYTRFSEWALSRILSLLLISSSIFCTDFKVIVRSNQPIGWRIFLLVVKMLLWVQTTNNTEESEIVIFVLLSSFLLNTRFCW